MFPKMVVAPLSLLALSLLSPAEFDGERPVFRISSPEIRLSTAIPIANGYLEGKKCREEFYRLGGLVNASIYIMGNPPVEGMVSWTRPSKSMAIYFHDDAVVRMNPQVLAAILIHELAHLSTYRMDGAHTLESEEYEALAFNVERACFGETVRSQLRRIGYER